MARQTYYVTREQKHPLYKTRMLQAGPLELDAGAARLFRQLGVDLSEEKPKAADLREGPEHRGGRIDTGTLAERPPAPAPSKTPARKRKARAKK